MNYTLSCPACGCKAMAGSPRKAEKLLGTQDWNIHCSVVLTSKFTFQIPLFL
jgi:hypothetical protein